MPRDIPPFEQLSMEDQKAALDIGVVATVLGTRIPSAGKPLFDFIVSEFVNSYSLPANIGKYALRQVGRQLYADNWEFNVRKEGNALVTRFLKLNAEGDNGEILINE